MTQILYLSIFVFLLRQFLKDFTSDDALRLLLSIEAFAVLFLIPCHLAFISPIPRQLGEQARVFLMPAVKKRIQDANTLDVRIHRFPFSSVISFSIVAVQTQTLASLTHFIRIDMSTIFGGSFRSWRYIQDCCQ